MTHEEFRNLQPGDLLQDSIFDMYGLVIDAELAFDADDENLWQNNEFLIYIMSSQTICDHKFWLGIDHAPRFKIVSKST